MCLVGGWRVWCELSAVGQVETISRSGGGEGGIETHSIRRRFSAPRSVQAASYSSWVMPPYLTRTRCGHSGKTVALPVVTRRTDSL